MNSMKRRGFTVPGERETKIGLGLAALGRPGYINLGHDADLGADYRPEAMQERAHRVLDEAWKSGVRYFDCARSYGRSEMFLGEWLRSRSVDGAVVGSKWGYRYTAEWQVEAIAHEIKEHSLSMLERQLDETRTTFGDALALYQIHSATQESGVMENAEVLSRLDALRETGCSIGVSVSGPKQSELIRQAASLEVNGRPLFDSVQATWNLLETSAGDALVEAHTMGLWVIVKEGLANGRLTTRNVDPRFELSKAVMTEIAHPLGAGIDAVALAAVLAQPWVGTVLSGAAGGEQLHSNLKARELFLGPDELSRLRALTESPETYWQRRSQLAWN